MSSMKQAKRIRTGKIASSGNNPVLNTGAYVTLEKLPEIPRALFNLDEFYFKIEVNRQEKLETGSLVIPDCSFPFSFAQIGRWDYCKVLRVEAQYKPCYDFGCPPPMTGGAAGQLYTWWKPPIYMQESWTNDSPPTFITEFLSNPRHKVVQQTRDGFTIGFVPKIQQDVLSSDEPAVTPGKIVPTNQVWMTTSTVPEVNFYNVALWADGIPAGSTGNVVMTYNISLFFYIICKKNRSVF